MSKKYVIDLPDDAQYILINGASENHCYTRVEQIDDLEELNSDYINEHYGSLQDEAYQRGFEDGKKSVSEPDCIEVGDEVQRDGHKFIVTKIIDDTWFVGIDVSGTPITVIIANVTKTGKHYDIQSILEAMRE